DFSCVSFLISLSRHPSARGRLPRAPSLSHQLQRAAAPFLPHLSAASSFSLSNDSKSTTTTLLSLPFRSVDRPSRNSHLLRRSQPPSDLHCG
ncbi:hypothetical protein B296_00007250, partial [Ensete ventricosum]